MLLGFGVLWKGEDPISLRVVLVKAKREWRHGPAGRLEVSSHVARFVPGCCRCEGMSLCVLEVIQPFFVSPVKQSQGERNRGPR